MTYNIITYSYFYLKTYNMLNFIFSLYFSKNQNLVISIGMLKKKIVQKNLNFGMGVFHTNIIILVYTAK